MDTKHNNLITNFYLTSAFPCSYIEGRQAHSVVAMPLMRLSDVEYGNLLLQGFRRSGYYIYRPQCDSCKECVPVRLRVADFKPKRSHRRLYKKFANFEIKIKPLVYTEEHFALYKKYQQNRHKKSSMAQDTPEHYQQFFLESFVDTKIVEFSLDGKIKIICLIDYVLDGISAVYNYFDTDDDKSKSENSGLGIRAILWQIEYTKQLNLPYLYLGYWINASNKMKYKEAFQPLEYLDGRTWHNWDSRVS